MRPAAIPSNEAERLRALRELVILDTDAEERFDRLTRLAQGLFDMPIALVSLVDSDRQWFKSRQGLEVAQTPRDVSVCAHAVLGEEVFVVPDLAMDERFVDNPLVSEDPQMRFYAGAPLKSEDGLAVGTLCVIDTEPRHWSDAQSRALRDLADLVEIELSQVRQVNQERALLALTEVTALDEVDRVEVLRQALALGCEYLGLPLGIVSRVTGQDYEVMAQVSPGTIVDGEHFALGETYCHIAIAGGDVLAIAEMSASEHAGHPCYETFGLEAYIGMPLEGTDGTYGTLNFSSPEPRPSRRFSEAEVDFVRLLGRWVSSLIRRWQLDDELERQHRISRFIARAQSTFILHDVGSVALEGLLADILELTGCEYGLIGDVSVREDGEPVLTTRALTNIAWNEATRELYARTGGRGIEFDRPSTLLGATFTSGEPVIANNPYRDDRSGGLPQDHPPMDSYLGLPIHREGLLVGLLGLANMPGGFTQGTIDYLQPLLATIGQLLEASAIRVRHEQDQAAIARLSMVASQMPSGVLITDPDGRIEWVNEGFTRMMGYAPEDLIGQRPRYVLHGSGTDAQTELRIREAMQAHEHFAAELLAYDRDSREVWVSLESTPLRDPDAALTGFIVIVTDINDRKRVERMKAEFVATVSHELRTPLTAISGALGLVAGGAVGPVPDRALGIVEIAHKNSQRLAALIDDLLDMEKLVHGGLPMKPELHDLMTIIDHAIVENQAYAHGFDVQLACVERSDGVRVNVDSLRLLQVLANLLSNAAKFAPAGSVVEVGARVRGDHVVVSVTDSGPGIPDSFRDVIFDKFSQADGSDSRIRGGTGLGLAISKELMDRMGGTIGYESTPGQGATFVISLPVEKGGSAVHG